MSVVIKMKKIVFRLSISLMILLSSFQPLVIVMAQEATSSSQLETPTPTLAEPTPTPTLIPSITPTTFPVAPVTTDITPTLSPTVILEENLVSNPSAITKKPIGMRLISNNYLQGKETLAVELLNTNNNEAQIILTKDDKPVRLTAKKKKLGDSIILLIDPPSEFSPGKYRLKATDSTGHTEELEFFWGVLAINTNKSIYSPDEEAKIAMAVLDEKGMMVCDAKLELRITNDESRINDLLSTENGKIKVNPECQIHNYTEKPDYEADYQVKGVGKYDLRLTAETKNGKYTVDDTIKVQDNIPFDIERISATRVYPPKLYPVVIQMTANQDFQGIIKEIVPNNFVINPIGRDDILSYQTIEEKEVSASQGAVLGTETPSLLLPFTGDYKISLGFGESYSDQNLIERITKFFGLAGHDGIDFDIKEGTEIYAVADGEVVVISDDQYGKRVVLRHEFGETIYGHLQEILVQEGQLVKKGEKIGLSGNTGISTGPHLHFGIKPKDADLDNGYSGMVDPTPYLGLSKDNNVLGVTDTIQKTKILSWEVNLKKGDKISLGYSFDAPDISPQFYLLGPLQFQNNDEIIFSEARRWQIAVDAAPGGAWWDANYQYRQKVTITAGSAQVPTGYTVSSTFNHANLVTNSKSLSSGNDIRIVYWNGSVWTELDRALDESSSWNNASTKVWFKTQAVINASASDDNYYMYYSYSSAGSPPVNKSNVYWYWDDFDRTDNADITSEAAYSKTNGGTWSIVSNQLKNVGAAGDPNKLLIDTLGSAAGDVEMQSKIDVTTWIGSADEGRMGLSSHMTSAGAGYCALLHQDTSSLDLLNDALSWGTNGTFSWTTSTWYYMKYQAYTPSAKTGRVKMWTVGSSEPSPWTVNGNFGTGAARASGYIGVAGSRRADVTYFDNLWVRKLVNTEPTVAQASEEPAPVTGPTNDQLMRHGKWFNNGVEQPFTF